MGMTLSGWLDCRQKARTDLLYLCNKVLGYKDVSFNVHGPLIDSFQKFKGGQDSKQIEVSSGNQFKFKMGSLVEDYKPVVPSFWDLEGYRKLLILMPRGHLKTTLQIAHDIQFILNYPNIRILLSAATGDQVKGFMRELKGHFQNNELFRFLFPEFVPQGKNVKEFGNQEAFTVPNCTRPNAKEPTVGSVSVGAVVASVHYDVIINDDTVDKENCRTPEQIQTVKNHLSFLWPILETAPNSDKRADGYRHGWWTLVGTRYDFADAYGTVIDEEEKKPVERKTYHILQLDAVVSGELSEEECKDNCEIKGKHQVIDHAVSLWPERLPPRALLAIANDPLQGPEILASQYRLNPIPASSGLVDSKDQIVWLEQPVMSKLYAYLSLHVTIDLAGMEPSSKTSDNDFTVINTHGFGRDGTLYVLPIIRGRYTPFEVINQLFLLMQLHPRILDMKVEKDAHARVLMPFLKREMERRGKWLPLTPIQRDNRTSKQQRIKGLQPWFRNGSIKFSEQPHKLAIINEIMRFPKYSHDDILDTIADAMQNREGGVVSDVVPMGKSLPQYDYSTGRPIPPELMTLARIWGEVEQEQPQVVDSLTGW